MTLPAYRLPGVAGLAALMNSAEFILPLGDLGAGAVDTSLARGTGTPTFTRATTAWTKLSSGLWASVASGTARSCYIGATTAVGAYGGYFAEAAGTQLVTPTADIRDMTGAGWVATTMTVAKTGTGIDGVVNACTRLTATGAGATVLHLLVAAASDRTYSCFIRRVTGTGTVKLVQGATKSSDFAASINTSTYTRLVLNATVDVTLLGYGIELGTSGDVIEVDFNQFEAGAIATSPMDAAGAARNVDLLTYPVSNLLAATGTCYVEATCSKNATAFSLASSGVLASTNNGTLLRIADVNDIRMTDGAGATIAGTVTMSATTPIKYGSSWGSGKAIFGSGALAVSDGSFTAFDVGSPLGIGVTGSGSGDSLQGTIKNVHIWQTQIASNAIVAMTA